MSYLASPLWLLLIGLGLLLALQAHVLHPDYFPHRFALFPTWLTITTCTRCGGWRLRWPRIWSRRRCWPGCPPWCWACFSPFRSRRRQGGTHWGGCRRLGLLVTPEETEPPAVLQRAHALLGEWEARCASEIKPLVRLAEDAQLRTLHAEMLPGGHAQPKGEYNADLLLGEAKLADADSVEEAAMLLTSREKLVVLAPPSGFQRLCQLGPASANGS